MSKNHRDRNWAPVPQALPADAHVVDNHTHVASVVPFSRAMSHEAQAKGQPEVPVYSVDELLHPLPADAHVVDNHTHVASVVPFSRAMSHEAQAKGQPEVPVYSVDELLHQAQEVGVEGVIDCGCELPNLMTAVDMAREHPGVQPEVPVYSVDELLHQAQEVGVEGVIDCGCELPNLMTAVDMAREHPGVVHAAIAIHPNESVLHGQEVGVEGVIDCGCELPNLMTAVDMAREHPGVVHAAIAIHPNESVLHGHRGVPGPDGLPLRYKPWHEVSFDDAIAEVDRIARAYPRQVVAIGETGMDLFRTGEGAKELQREAFRAHIAIAKELDLSARRAWTCSAPAKAPRSCSVRRSARISRSRRNSTCRCRSMTATRTAK